MGRAAAYHGSNLVPLFFFTPGEYFADAGFVLGTYLGLTNRALRIRLFGSSLS